MSKEHPNIAIFMSAYNHEKFVAKTMESILAQTYPHWELFVADDGSDDKTAEIIASYQDERIHFYPLKENTQLVGAWEMLMDLIRTRDFDYVQSMASDDVLHPQKLEKQIRFLEEHPQYAACFTWAAVIDGDGNEDPENDYFNFRTYSRYEWLLQLFHGGNLICCNTALIRRDVYFEMDTMNQRFIMLADFRLWYMIVGKYPAYLMQEKLIYYRKHEENLSRTSFSRALLFMQESARVMKEVLLPMDADTFRRAHYSLLPYREIRSDAELLAAKFISLVNGLWGDKCQIAIDLYFDHVSDREFLRVLKEQYGFEGKDFTILKENGGLPYAANDISKRNEGEDYLPQEPPQTYPAWGILFDDIKVNGVTDKTFDKYTYTALRQLHDLKSDEESVASIREMILNACKKAREAYRKRLSKRRVLFIVSAFSDWRLNRDNTPLPPDGRTEYYVGYVNPTDVLKAADLQSLVREDMEAGTELEVTQYVDLFDERNQALLFADEVVPDLTDICYVDCFDDDYECRSMTDSYSLHINQLTIMEKEQYDRILEQDATSLKMMEAVFFY